MLWLRRNLRGTVVKWAIPGVCPVSGQLERVILDVPFSRNLHDLNHRPINGVSTFNHQVVKLDVQELQNRICVCAAALVGDCLYGPPLSQNFCQLSLSPSRSALGVGVFIQFLLTANWFISRFATYRPFRLQYHQFEWQSGYSESTFLYWKSLDRVTIAYNDTFFSFLALSM